MFNPVYDCVISVTVVIMSRLVYRKGADFLGVIIPDICSHFPTVDFIIGNLSALCMQFCYLRNNNSLTYCYYFIHLFTVLCVT